MGEQLSGETLIIVDLGRIGRGVAKRMQAFYMKVTLSSFNRQLEQSCLDD